MNLPSSGDQLPDPRVLSDEVNRQARQWAMSGVNTGYSTERILYESGVTLAIGRREITDPNYFGLDEEPSSEAHIYISDEQIKGKSTVGVREHTNISVTNSPSGDFSINGERDLHPIFHWPKFVTGMTQDEWLSKGEFDEWVELIKDFNEQPNNSGNLTTTQVERLTKALEIALGERDENPDYQDIIELNAQDYHQEPATDGEVKALFDMITSMTSVEDSYETFYANQRSALGATAIAKYNKRPKNPKQMDHFVEPKIADLSLEKYGEAPVEMWTNSNGTLEMRDLNVNKRGLTADLDPVERSLYLPNSVFINHLTQSTGLHRPSDKTAREYLRAMDEVFKA